MSEYAFVDGKFVNRRGLVHKILQEAAKRKSLTGDTSRTLLMLKMKLAVKTGLVISKYTPDSLDDPKEVEKILEVIRSPAIGLPDFRL